MINLPFGWVIVQTQTELAVYGMRIKTCAHMQTLTVVFVIRTDTYRWYKGESAE